MSIVAEHKSRFGYHPCSYELYLKLKYIYKHYWKALVNFADWQRWSRKYPQNRVIRKRRYNEKRQRIGYEVVSPRPEPAYCPLFVEKTTKYGINYVSVSDFGFIKLFLSSRNPSVNPVEPFSNEVVNKIESFYQQLLEYNGEVDKMPIAAK